MRSSESIKYKSKFKMKKVFKEWNKTICIFFLILTLGLILRLYNLTLLPVFVDEAIYIRWAQVMQAEPTLRFLPLSDGKQPFFMWSVIPFLKIFSDPLFAGRFVSVLSGIGTLVGVFALSYLLFKNRIVSLVSSVIYALSPFAVFFDRMALVDSMLTFFGVWTLFFGVLTAKTLRLDFAMLTGFVLGGALLTKSPAIFFVILLPSVVLFLAKLGLKYILKLCVLLFVTYLIAYGMYNVLRLGPNFHLVRIRNADYVYPFTHVFERPLDPFLPYIDRVKEYIWIMGPSVLIVLTAVGIFYGLKRKPKATLLLMAWGILPVLVVSEFSKTMTARYIYFSVPYFFILASLTFLGVNSVHTGGRLNSQGVKLIHPKGGLGSHPWVFGIFYKLSLVILLVFFLHSAWLDYQLLTDPQKASLPRSERSGYLEEWTAGTGIREVAEYIKDEYQKDPSTGIVVGTEGFFGTLPDGLQIYLNNYKDIVVKGVGVIITDVHPSLLESKRSGNETYLVVNDTRFKGDTEKLGLRLISSYPKALRPDNIKESLLFFEVTDKALFNF